MILLKSEVIKNDFPYYLYAHIRLDTNQPFYIGIGGHESINRNYYRANQKTQRSKYWLNTINKTSFKVKILLHSNSWEEICKKEKEFIKLYGRKNLNKGILVNLTDGGEGTSGTNKNNNVGIREKNNPKRLENLRKACCGVTHSKEILDLIASKNRGQKRSDETKLKMSLDRKGKTFTPAKRILQMDINGNLIKEWESAKEVNKVLNYDYACTLRATRNGKLFHNYKWKKV